ncbi:hypothetical protein B0H13DRAFT_2240057 [Mycena leptocephala]|nr:hypothetical protein B0H13DRAFT_2240057 [Mycena leptocephala]
MNKSVMISQQAIALTPDGDPEKPLRLANLGASLLRRFQQLKNPDDINNSVKMIQQANKAAWLYNLGNCLGCRFEQFRDLTDINQSVLMFQQAPRWLKALGNSLCHRFKHRGNLDHGDLNESVLTLDGHPGRAERLDDLGRSLEYRFQHLRDLNDINESVLIFQQAHPNKPIRFTHLGNSFRYRFEQLGDLNDLNESVTLHPDKPRQLGDLSDINKSVLMFQQAAELIPDGDPDRPALLNNFGNSLVCRYEWLGDHDDINEAALKYQQAVILMPDKLTPDGHPDKPGYLNNLSSSLWARFQQLRNPDDQNQILSHYMSAACSSTGPASMRFYAASMWAKHAQTLGLLPDVAWLGLSIHDRHYHIRAAGRVVRDAVAAAITAAQYHKAVEWLEQGRSVIWGQLLNLRTPVEALRETYPDLADKFVSLSMQLEGAGTRAASPQILSMDLQSQTSQSTAQQYHERANERDRLLNEIRGLSGFERFLLPKTMSELSLTAGRGPIVLLNISEFRCDALVLMSGLADEVLHIPLPNFTFEHGQNLAKSIPALVHTRQRGERRGMQREGHVPREVQLAIMLSELWSQVVKPVLDGLSITNPQRIWWCPTGPLSFLPIHAAGLYGDNEAFGSKLSDFVISSYVPSITALIKGLRAKPVLQDRLQLLVVAQHLHIQQGMKGSRWVHFACHGVQDMSAPTQSALLLAGSSTVTLSNIIETLEESAHLAAGMLWAGYHGVIATMWSIMDMMHHRLLQMLEHLFKTSPPDPTRAAEALTWLLGSFVRDRMAEIPFHWVPFIHVGFNTIPVN